MDRSSDLERQIAAIWADALGRGSIGVDDNVYELGADEAIASEVHRRIQDMLVVRWMGASAPAALAARIEPQIRELVEQGLPRRAVFEHPTARLLAASLEPAGGEGAEDPGGGQRPPTETAATYPLSRAQRRIWLQHRLDPTGTAYNVVYAVHLGGPLDARALEGALTLLVERHDVLRTTIVERDGELAQRVQPAGAVPWRVTDLSPLSADVRQTRLRDCLLRAAREPFDLEHGPLLRAEFVRLDAGDHRLVLGMHHLVVDGGSWGVLYEELTSAYGALCAGAAPLLAPLPMRYVDYAAWQNERFASGALAGSEEYWLRRFADGIPELALPVDHRDPPVRTFQRHRHIAVFDRDTADRVRAIGRQVKATPFIVHLAVLTAFLRRITGQDDLVVGSPVAGRDRPDVDRVVGCFINTVLLRTRIEGDPRFEELVSAVRAEAIDAYEHQQYPLDLLVQKLNDARAGEHGAAVQVLFANAEPQAPRVAGGVEFSVPTAATIVDPSDDVSLPQKFDFHAGVMDELDGRLTWVLGLSADLFEADTARRIIRRFETFVQDLAHRPTAKLSSLAILPADEAEALRLRRARGRTVYPPAFNQREMWVQCQLQAGDGLNNIGIEVAMNGPLDAGAFRDALQTVVDRHEALRTIFDAPEGEPVQRVAPVRAALVTGDISQRPPDLQRELIAARCEELVRTSFALERAPLFRAELLRLATDRSVFIFVVHHLVLDAFHLPLFLEELARVYQRRIEGATEPLDPPPFQYGDFAIWEEEVFKAGLLSRHQHYWHQQLRLPLPAMSIPADRQPAAGRTFDSGCVVRRLPREAAAALKKLERRYRTTVFRVIAAAFEVWLWRMTGETDLLVAMPFSTRPNELRDAIGFFGNTLPLRLALDADQPFHELLGRVTDQLREARDHRDYPLTEALGQLNLARDPNRPALPICLSQIRQFAASAGELEMKASFPFTRGAAFDLWLAVAESRDSVELELIYATELFSEASVQHWADALVALLASAAANPEAPVRDLRLVTGEFENTLRVWSGGGLGAAETDTVAAALAAVVARTPAAIAVQADGTTWTYSELQWAAGSVSQALHSAGVGRESRVGIIGTRSPGMLASVIGVLQAGGAFVPLEASQPDTRLQTTVISAGVSALLCDRESFGRAKTLVAGTTPAVRVMCWDDGGARDPGGDVPAATAGPTDLAYIFYTSGSTGVPKGVMVEQRGMSNHLRAKIATLGLDSTCVVAQTASYGFDIVVWQWLAPLLAGGRVVMYDDVTAYDPAGLLRAMARDGVTVVETVPSFLDAMAAVDDAPALPALRWMVSNAEALPPAVAVRWRARYPGARLLNTCGATECSDDTTHGEVLLSSADEAVRVTVGKPIPGATASIVDEMLRPVPPGCVGEIVYGGTCVGRGYLGDPVATARAFVPDPRGEVPGARLYRTGDRGRWRPDGELECLGRTDDQVKVHGYRVELGEVEAALATLPGLAQVAAAVRNDTRGQRRLVAYYVAAGNADESAMRAALSTRLPPYMVPNAFVRLPALTRTRTGKLDRAALPAPSAVDVAVVPEAVATRVEAIVADVWQQVLQVPVVGRHDNFFDLGGDSIQSILVAARLSQRGIRTAPRAVFAHQTVAELARVAGQSAQVRVRDDGTVEPAPLLPIQQAFFDRQVEDAHHWNQAVIAAPSAGDEHVLRQALQATVDLHPALRMRFFERDGRMWQQPAAGEPVSFEIIDLDASGEPMQSAATRVQRSLDLERGPVFRAALMRASGAPDRLLIVAHHLVIDTVSWGVLTDDLGHACAQLAAGEPVDIVPEATTYAEWAQALSRVAERFEPERPYWQSVVARRTQLPRDRDLGPNTAASVDRVRASVDAESTRRLLTGARRGLQADIITLLLCAFARAAGRWVDSPDLTLFLEGHGREDLVPGADLGRTIGWFTAAYPICLDTQADDVPAHVARVRDTLRAIPNHGIGYGFLRWSSRTLDASEPEISFNYHGQVGRLVTSDHLTLVREPAGEAMSSRGSRPVLVNVECRVVEGRLDVECLFSTNVHAHGTIARLVDAFVAELGTLAALCDDTLPANAEEIYPLAPIQEGMLFHALFEPESSLYYEQAHLELEGALNVDALQSAWDHLLAAHPILRSVIRWEGFPDPVQVVLAPSPEPIRVVDVQHLSAAAQDAYLSRDADEQWAERFSLDRGPLVRLSLFVLGPERYSLVWNFHHILLDGWSVTTLLRDLTRAYEAVLEQKPVVLTHARPYRDFVLWLRQQDRAAALDFWRGQLAGVESPTPLPRDRARPPARRRAAAHVDLAVPADLAASLDRWARAERVTTSALLRAAWAILLARMSGTRDVVFGATVSGRPAALGGVERMVGPFINAVPARIAMADEESVAALVARVHEQSVEASAYEYLPLPDIQKACGIPADRPLFDSLFAYENYPAEGRPRTMGGVRLRGGSARELTHYDLTLLADTSDTLRGRLAYATDVFDHATAKRIVVGFVNLLRAIAANPRVRLADLSFVSSGDEPLPVAISEKAHSIPPSAPPAVDGREPTGETPLTPFEAAVAAVWRDVLQVPQVRRRDTFFDLGGHSLTAIRIVAALKERLGRQVPIWQLFKTPALSEFARAIEHAPAESAPELSRVEDRPWYPVSAAQRAQWIVGQLSTGDESHPPRLLQLEGDLDRDALAGSLQALVDRHDVLRTTFEERDGDVVQVVHDRMDLTFASDDLAGLPGEARAARLREIVQAESRRPFDLSRLPLFEVRVARVEPARQILLLRLPHIVSDGWTEGILVEDLAELYNARHSGRRAMLPPLRVRYVDVCAHQNDWLASAALQSQKAYWIDRFSDDIPVLRLPVDVPAGETDRRTALCATTLLDEGTVAALRATATSHGATLFSALLTAFNVLLARLSGQSDLVVGTTAAGRGSPQLERVAGVFANMLPLRTSFDGNPSFAEAMRRVSETTLAAMARQDYPYQLWIDELRRRRRQRDLHLFSAFFVVHEEAFSPEFEGLTPRWLGTDALGNTLDPRSLRWDQRQQIVFAANDTGNGWRITVLGEPAVFTQASLERVLQQWIGIVEQVSANPERRLDDVEVALAPDAPATRFATVVLEPDELDRLFT